ncbi:transporter, cation channel family protein [Necator americanus]|uniref:Transporter, cation channel family protein n=1 Tax=Necator americanus TaxID=51031 RepID=W2SR04_NECAM|nr:transporter, cation channel family protein [Necator americanus]ETN72174.1 transporter, cation channel family protein [Necator americanus]
MLTRRKSSLPSDGKTDGGSGGQRKRRGESVVALTEIINLEPSAINKKPSEILQNDVLKELVRLACLLSMISVCLHTPETIQLWPPLNYAIFANDCIVTLVFLVEAAINIHHVGLWENESSYLRAKWSQFDLFMLLMHVLSCALHCYELFTILVPSIGLVYRPWFGVIRSPRPFIMLRFIRSLVRFKLPKNRIKQIIKRSSQQIQNVTIFFMFFMALYAIMGVQLFGRMDYHCVLSGTDPRNVTIADLAIPDTMCSQKGEGGYECPDNMVCMKLDMSAHVEGFYGMFNDFASSLFTVYMAASQEGWVYVLYDCLDTLPSYVAFFYFVTLIFFLAWLVKNVFIAVITETFAEIRVQFSEMWQSNTSASEETYTQRLERFEDGWRLVEIDHYSRGTNSPQFLHLLVNSTAFQIAMMVLVLLNALINASFVYRHDNSDIVRKEIYYYVEICFTIIFNLEALIKVIGYGWKGYLRRGQHKFELILCVGSTLNLIRPLYSMNIFTYFQVFRIVRLIKASPMLEDFVYKIFGPGKKLGGLVVFTMVLLFITSAISLQLFCYVPNLKKFTTFPMAFMSMFQIITQEGWTDVVVEILRATNESMVPFVAIYFVGYHLLVTLIVLSLFVAVILDNLEMDEELKKVKQLKAREQNTIKTTLPWRLRVFDRFPTRPQMISLRKMTSEFPLPKIRDSFTRQFADENERNNTDANEADASNSRSILRRGANIRAQWKVRMRHIGQNSSRHILTSLLDDFIGLMTYLDWAMVFVTSLSCWSMLFESPWPTNGENLIFNNPYLQITEYLYVASMTFELVVKVIANGLFFTPKAVVKDVGDIMTFFIYFIARHTDKIEFSRNSLKLHLQTSVIYLLWMPSHVEINSWAQMLMIMRAMRPLRIYTLVPHIRRVVVELCRGFKEILLVTVLLIVLMFIFASFGVQIVGGKLAACNDPTITERENCTGVFEQKIFVTRMEVYGKNDDKLHPKILVPRVWTNPRNFNFDHIGNAMLALFETLSYKGWNVIRDILYLRQGPWAVLFIHIYVFIGCMIGLTLFVGVVVANYTENRGTALLTVDQRRWHDLKARLKMAQPLHVPPKPPESAKLRSYLYDLTLSRGFKQSFAILVVINSFTLVVPWNVEEEKQRRNFLFGLTILSAFCNILFTIEIILKSVAFTVRGFWQSRRNRGDFLITILGLTWIVFHFLFQVPAYIAGGINEWKRLTYTFGYMVVILRFFTIAGRKSTLKMLMLTVLMSMVRSLFIIAAMFLLVLFYAYTGVILFGMVKYGQAVSKKIIDYSNENSREIRSEIFSFFSQKLNFLRESLNSEERQRPVRSPPFCYWAEGLNYWETDCGNYFGAIVYFCSFYLIITYIVLNLLVAIIMENFSLFYSSEEDALLSYADIRNFQQVWNIVDADQKRSIPTRRVKFLLRLLRGRLEVDPNKDRLLFKHMCYEMERLHNGEDVSFHDVLNMLSYRSVDIRKSLQLEELLQREELEYLIEEEVAKQTIRAWLEQCLRRIKQKQNVVGPTVIVSGALEITVNIFQQNQPETVVPTSLALHRLSCLIPLVPHVPSQLNLQTTLTTPQTTAPNFESFDSRESGDEDGGSRKKQRRRNSIPELVGEAKKFMFGSLAKRLEKAAESKSGKDRRGTLKQLQMPTYELPDLEENLDEASDSPHERRHSVDTPLSNNPDLLIMNTSTPSVEFQAIEPNPDLQQWWTDLFEL